MKTTRPLLTHLAIIPDGNRRWAKQHSITEQQSMYSKGCDKAFEIAEAAINLSVPFVTFWASSYANLAERPKAFAAAMESLYAKRFQELRSRPFIHEQRVHITIIGEWRTLLRPETAAVLQETMDATADYNDRELTILVGYDGQHERGYAAKSLLEQNLSTAPHDYSDADALLKQHAWSSDLPDVDLIIRTGSWEDPHNSASFLSFLVGNAQYAFPPVLWPDFDYDMLKEIVDSYSERERRLGR
jgi:undecaprenyl diphosphate synthase